VAGLVSFFQQGYGLVMNINYSISGTKYPAQVTRYTTEHRGTGTTSSTVYRPEIKYKVGKTTRSRVPLAQGSSFKHYKIGEKIFIYVHPKYRAAIDASPYFLWVLPTFFMMASFALGYYGNYLRRLKSLIKRILEHGCKITAEIIYIKEKPDPSSKGGSSYTIKFKLQPPSFTRPVNKEIKVKLNPSVYFTAEKGDMIDVNMETGGRRFMLDPDFFPLRIFDMD